MPVAVEEIIREKRVTSHFQPILSFQRGRVAGVEALARGLETDQTSLIAPYQLFEQARQEGLSHKLDDLCRKTALKSFEQIHALDPEMLLFANFEASILDEGVSGSGLLLHALEETDIPPSNVVVEIVESKVENLQALRSFVTAHKQYGFLVALDDVGAGHSNLDRIAIIQPDILKLDAALIRNIQEDYYKQEVFKSLASLCRKIGALVLAEGVETEAESLKCLELGADLFQGYHFARPAPYKPGFQSDPNRVLQNLATQFRSLQSRKLQERKRVYSQHYEVLTQMLHRLVEVPPQDYESLLGLFVQRHPTLECLYVLDAEGTQVTRPLVNPALTSERKSRIFQAPPKGTDHSLREYYYSLVEGGFLRYTTDPYLSMASGSLCITISAWIQSGMQPRRHLLCMDVRAS